MKMEIILPIVTLILGFLLSELSYIFRSRGENKKSIGTAISFLLEIRHQLIGLEIMVNKVKDISSPSEETELQLKNFMDNYFSQFVDIGKKYDGVVDSISMFNPLLAFQLRAKDKFKPLLQNLRNLALNDKSSIHTFNNLEKILSQKYKEILEDIISELSRAHSIKTRVRIKKYMLKKIVFSEEFEEIFSLFTDQKK